MWLRFRDECQSLMFPCLFWTNDSARFRREYLRCCQCVKVAVRRRHPSHYPDHVCWAGTARWSRQCALTIEQSDCFPLLFPTANFSPWQIIYSYTKDLLPSMNNSFTFSSFDGLYAFPFDTTVTPLTSVAVCSKLYYSTAIQLLRGKLPNK